MKVCVRWSVLLLAAHCSALAAESLEFDARVLRDRGIDPALAAYFREAPRFIQGEHSVALEVNGQARGRVRVSFNERGELCLHPQWLNVAGVRPPTSMDKLRPEQCMTLAEGFPEAIVRLDPGRERIDLLVPTDSLMLAERAPNNFAHGGTAGVFNYDALMVGSQHEGRHDRFQSLGSEVGLNAGDWVLRSRQSYTSTSGNSRFEHLYAYGARTLEDAEASLQVGQLNLASSLFAGESFNGVQIVPEAAFTQLRAAQDGARGQVEGVAYSPARIEVRQNGVLIYTTMVPSGPFTLRALPLLSNRIDLEVTVHEQDGQARRLRVPAASLHEAQWAGPSGFNFALGTVRRLGSDDRKTPSFTALSKDWDWGQATRLSAGLLAATDYLSTGWGLQRQWAGGYALGVKQVLSDDRSSGAGGSQTQLTFSAPLSESLSTSLVAVRQSRNFRTLSDTGWDQEHHRAESPGRDHLVFSLTGSVDQWGAFGATWSRYSTQGEPSQSRLGLSWSRTLPERISLSLNLERAIGDTASDRLGNSAYLTLGMALGGQRRLRGYLRRDDRSGLRRGVAVSDVLGENLAYNANAEYRDETAASYGVRFNALPRYTSLDVGVGQRSGATDYDVGLRGGVALHRDGATLSPYPLRDTFGVLKAGDRSGVKLNTPQGPVWTDGSGHAVAASLPAWSTARLEVDPLSLSRNVEVLDGVKEVQPARGSVQHLDFSLVTVRRLLLNAMTVDRQWLAKGLSVHDEQGCYLTTVQDAGTIFLPDAKAGQRLHVQLPDNTRCELRFPLSESPDDSALIERVDATCAPAELS
ncbi:fimbria/pilus outer membrane usher protein [Pseudomonas koreensis]|uniref:fimbria/pilus outer membrane usher protein n=1 Tax=Pseudomonas koreensis TaxID=198620 RepID=UPI0021C8DC3E|nr:fimbria/pilus outer membrane usher protein [Pseudomonas koreensis]MCU0090005.1 fimbria/pilus outer membrane usher protein [Pseudomonas koreensis]